MTKGLVSDSDKFKIIIMLHQVQKIGDTGQSENLLYCNHIWYALFCNFGSDLMLPLEP